MQLYNMLYASQQDNLNYLFPPFYFFFLPFQNLTQKVTLFLHHCLSKKIPAKRKSLTPCYTYKIALYKIQGKLHTNKMGFLTIVLTVVFSNIYI